MHTIIVSVIKAKKIFEIETTLNIAIIPFRHKHFDISITKQLEGKEKNGLFTVCIH